MSYIYFIFFFKQKTAYEMRISDWSSDVCSSDLDDDPPAALGRGQVNEIADAAHIVDHDLGAPALLLFVIGALDGEQVGVTAAGRAAEYRMGGIEGEVVAAKIGRAHVELQSLMRISYAVFCLKKKNSKNDTET